MSEVTRILSQIESGDPAAADRLLPLVYDELRKLAAARLAHEKPGGTLQATALVHEAYLRLVGAGGSPVSWDSRGHFFAAAAESMRRVLVENARHKTSQKRGGQRVRVELVDLPEPARRPSIDLLLLDEALDDLERHDLRAAQLVKLRYFAGLGHQEAAAALGVGRRTADGLWALARAWLLVRLEDQRP